MQTFQLKLDYIMINETYPNLTNFTFTFYTDSFFGLLGNYIWLAKGSRHLNSFLYSEAKV